MVPIFAGNIARLQELKGGFAFHTDGTHNMPDKNTLRMVFSRHPSLGVLL